MRRSCFIQLWRVTAIIVVAALMLPLVPAGNVAAEAPANDHFQRSWARSDKPVADNQVDRTWMWGPEAFTGAMSEPYAQSPGAERTVQYFDKSRMEITHPEAGDPSSVWYVTNGLLVVELITGQLQLGDDTFEARAPAAVNVAGDADDPTGPTYATFNGLLDVDPLPVDSLITQRIDRDGTVTEDPALATEGVTVGYLDEVTDHTVATPFWDFMNSSGTVWENGAYVEAALFVNPFYATGRPVTEAYWAEVKVAGTYQDVLLQCFERRCLTYTPQNEVGWQVEAGNVGQHYYTWRYEHDGGQAGELLVSLYPDRSAEVRLEGQTVSGDVYIFLAPATQDIEQVRFYLDDPEMTNDPHRIDREQPYDLADGTADTAVSYDTTMIADGSHTITVAIDRPDGTTEIVNATFTVMNPELPEVIELPGRFEAESYKPGGEGVGYHDTTPGNAGGQYRYQSVDIETTLDPTTPGGYNVGWIRPGEWLAYDVTVASAGEYVFISRVATIYDDQSFRIELDGSDITGPLAVPHTGGWQNWVDIRTGPIELPAGEHELRVVTDTGYFNLNYFVVEKPPLVEVPGMFQVEDYKPGGEGVGYHDTSIGNAGGEYHVEDVDIQTCSDPAEPVGAVCYNVGWIREGEWLAYDIKVASEGDYRFVIRAATPYQDRSFHLELDRVPITDSVTVRRTGDWQSWTDVMIGPVTLPAGEHELRIVMETDDFNLNWVRIEALGD